MPKLLLGNLAVSRHGLWPRAGEGSDATIPAASLHCVLPVARVAVAARAGLTAPAGLSWALK